MNYRMFSLAKFCYVCMTDKGILKSFDSLNNDNLTILNCTFSAIWTKSSSMHICTGCSDKLQQACDFLNMCRKTCKLMKSYIRQLNQSDSYTTGTYLELCVSMLDFMNCTVKEENSENVEGQTGILLRNNIEDMTDGIRIKTEFSGNIQYEEDAENESQHNIVSSEFNLGNMNIDDKLKYSDSDKSRIDSINSKSNFRAKHPSSNNTDNIMNCGMNLKNHNKNVVENQNVVSVPQTLCSSLEKLECKPDISVIMPNTIGSELEAVEDLSAKENYNSHFLANTSDTDIAMHTDEEDTSQMELNDGNQKTYTCTKCFKVFTERIHFINHKTSAMCSSICYKCSVCDKVFPYRASFVEHMSTHNYAKSHTDAKQYKCGVCDKLFYRPYALRNHMNHHNSLYKCSVCNETFKKATGLDRHMGLHDKNRAFKCQFCARRYAHLSGLIRHQQTHT